MDFFSSLYSLIYLFGSLCVYIYIVPKSDILCKFIVSPCASAHGFVEKVWKIVVKWKETIKWNE